MKDKNNNFGNKVLINENLFGLEEIAFILFFVPQCVIL